MEDNPPHHLQPYRWHSKLGFPNALNFHEVPGWSRLLPGYWLSPGVDHFLSGRALGLNQILYRGWGGNWKAVMKQPCVRSLNGLRRIEIATIFNGGACRHYCRHEKDNGAASAGGERCFHKNMSLMEWAVSLSKKLPLPNFFARIILGDAGVLHS
jgi:hypothetical protein